ncbi:glycosyltransferase family 2 protein [Acinetobacter sp. SWBY1]|uniref:glycosyltransferase family 2 protein n=1 Tax=Acinetobacter sp. SWBY1 TaxID=2079596 RepID=UPI000CF2B9BE|nr:glycosyltransferase family 2 protein [Acinetobacter sp. SWBY1]AVH49942.1 capsular biosynthesis protein CpsI [Acinetobacter sp. SWBY1]
MFSVVIPLYNKEKYIGRAVESVLAQTYQDFELIVVDDGSTDASVSQINSIFDPRLRIIQQKNQGEGPARNAGIQVANREWIAFLDADDAWLPDHLDELSNIINKHPNAKMLSTSCAQIEDSNEKFNVKNSLNSHIREIDYFYEASIKIGIINSTSLAINKCVFLDVGGFNQFKAGADLECWARIALKYNVAISNKITCCYFRDTGGVMQSLAAKKATKPVTTLSDISPSVNMLVQQSKRDSSILHNQSIRRYINSRLFNGVKASLFKNEYLNAKSVSKLALPQLNLLYTLLFIFSYTPTFFLKAGVKLVQFLRNKKR